MRLRVAAGEALLRLLGGSWRIAWEGEDDEAAARRASPGGNVILAFWHGSLLVLAYTHRQRHVHVLVSQHRDGEWIARVLARLGHELVRGSSRRGGVEALFQLATRLEAGDDVAVTVDGPVGPRYTVHPGVVLLARRTGRPIVPLVPTYLRGRRLRTWDELQVPDFGSRVRVRALPPLLVPAATTSAGLTAFQARLEAQLRDGTRAAEERLGRTVDFDDVIDRRSYWERRSEAPRPGGVLRALAGVHAVGLAIERRLRPRRRGRATRPWVIGVGNLEAGGTGKTPVTAALARSLVECGATVAVLTRGHGGTLGRFPEFAAVTAGRAASDETHVLLHALGEGVPVLVSRDKGRGLATLRSDGRFDVVVVDDAFQTAGLAVDRHLVLLDAERPLGNGHLLPAGRLREPPRALRRADALLFTRAPAGGLPAHPALASLPARRFAARESAAGLRRLDGTAVDGESLRGQAVALLSGLGRPQAFERLARTWGAAHAVRVRRAVRVGDHAPLETALRRLVGALAALECQRVFVTAKDAFRLADTAEWNEPLLVFEQRLVIQDLARLLEVLLPAGQFAWSAKLPNVTDIEAGT